MNEEEREIVKKFERLYLKDFNNEKITNEDRLSYIECALITNLIEKLQKENEELKEKNEELEEINNELEAVKNEAIRRYNFETIPIQKVKDKIEELNQYYKKEIHPSLYQWADITITEHYDEMIELLQELLEEGGENG